MTKSDIGKVPATFRDTGDTDLELAGRHPRERSPTPNTAKGGTATSTLISGLLLSLVLTINAYAQPPSAPTSGAAAGAAATAFFIKFKVMPGKNADFEKAISEMMVGVREKEPGNVYCDLVHLAQDPQTYAIIERYKDARASKAHVESEYIKKLGDALKNGLLDGPPELQELVFVRSK
jgi:quinol monooxygenase YgiN